MFYQILPFNSSPILSTVFHPSFAWSRFRTQRVLGAAYLCDPLGFPLPNELSFCHLSFLHSTSYSSQRAPIVCLKHAWAARGYSPDSASWRQEMQLPKIKMVFMENPSGRGGGFWRYVTLDEAGTFHHKSSVTMTKSPGQEPWKENLV